MKCPICSAPLTVWELRTNHEPMYQYRVLIGYVRGVPDASFLCSGGCEIRVKGVERYEAVLRLAGA